MCINGGASKSVRHELKSIAPPYGFARYLVRNPSSNSGTQSKASAESSGVFID